MAASPGGEKHVTFLLDNVPAKSTVTDTSLVELIRGKVEWSFRGFAEGKFLMRARFSEEGTYYNSCALCMQGLAVMCTVL